MIPSSGQGGDIVLSTQGGTHQVQDLRPKRVYARISGAAGGAGADYPWTQILETSSTLPDYTASGFAKSGTASVLPFREINARTDVPSGTKVRGDLSADGTCYLFSFYRWSAKGKLDGALSFGGSATMSVWEVSGGTEADTGENLTVYDWLLKSGQSVASGIQVVANYIAGRWYVVGAQCS